MLSFYHTFYKILVFYLLKNISTLSELITQAQKNGIKFIACNMSMDVMGIKKEELLEGVEIGGVAKYISESNNANSNLFI